MVVGGLHNNSNVEIVSLGHGSSCQEINFPMQIYNIHGAAYGVIDGNPTICSGYQNGATSKDCFQYNTTSYTFKKINQWQLTEGVYHPAYAQWRSSGIIMVGGITENGNPSDLIQIAGTSQSWKFMMIEDSCLVHFYGDTFFLIGGTQNGTTTDKTYLITPKPDGNLGIHLQSLIFAQKPYILSGLSVVIGPPLNRPRYDHFCGTMQKNGKRFIIVIGSHDEDYGERTTESLDLTNLNEWQLCTSTPNIPKYPTLVNDPENGDLLVLGGYETTYSTNIYKITDICDSWTKLTEELQSPNSRQVAFFVNDSMVPCN